jgi:hypothetical protein
MGKPTNLLLTALIAELERQQQQDNPEEKS